MKKKTILLILEMYITKSLEVINFVLTIFHIGLQVQIWVSYVKWGDL